jgi:hypothetical protein
MVTLAPENTVIVFINGEELAVPVFHSVPVFCRCSVPVEQSTGTAGYYFLVLGQRRG